MSIQIGARAYELEWKMKYLEISDKGTGKTTRLLNEIKRCCDDGNHCTLLCAEPYGLQSYVPHLFSDKNRIILDRNRVQVINCPHRNFDNYEFSKIRYIKDRKFVFMDDFDQSIFCINKKLFHKHLI